MKTARLTAQSRARLDERLAHFGAAEGYRPPGRGWIRAIREALGMIAASWAATEMGIFAKKDAQRIKALLSVFALPATIKGITVDKALAAMRSDKKAVAGKLRFVLPTMLGAVEVFENVDQALVRAALEVIGCE